MATLQTDDAGMETPVFVATSKEVIVTGLKIPFLQILVLMLKVAIASIPAAIILTLLALATYIAIMSEFQS